MWRVQALETLSDVRAAIWTSGLERDVFTAGNDIKELYAPNTSLSRCAAMSYAHACSSGVAALLGKHSLGLSTP